MTGGTIWLSFNANQVPFATEHPLPNFPMHSGVVAWITGRLILGCGLQSRDPDFDDAA